MQYNYNAPLMRGAQTGYHLPTHAHQKGPAKRKGKSRAASCASVGLVLLGLILLGGGTYYFFSKRSNNLPGYRNIHEDLHVHKVENTWSKSQAADHHHDPHYDHYEHHDEHHHHYDHEEHHHYDHDDDDHHFDDHYHHADDFNEPVDRDHMDDHLGLYDMGFVVTEITGKELHLHDLKGNVSLFVNVASECGYTASNYDALVQFQTKYSRQGLVIVAVPCNDFGNQEPKSNHEILEFAHGKGANFLMLSKIHEINSDPVFTWLRAHAPAIKHDAKPAGSKIAWNFEKFLVDKWGHVIDRYGSAMNEAEVERDIQILLAEEHDEEWERLRPEHD